MTLGIITDPACSLHEMGAHHPECPARMDAIHKHLKAINLLSRMQPFDARKASRAQLLAAHDDLYVDFLFESSPTEGLTWLDGDTAMNPHSLNAALFAAGAAARAVDLVMDDQVTQVFCMTRPPGHHAEHGRAMGFCLFNNAAVAAHHALNHWGLERVAIFDFDVHHGNGTEEIFLGDDRVLFCSSFQHPYYPGSGADTDAANIINIPLPAETGGVAFRRALSEQALPRLEDFAAQLVIICAGFDGHRDEQLAHFNLVEDDFAWITRELNAQALRHAEGRVVSCLEGGYDLKVLPGCVEAHLRVFLDG